MSKFRFFTYDDAGSDTIELTMSAPKDDGAVLQSVYSGMETICTTFTKYDATFDYYSPTRSYLDVRIDRGDMSRVFTYLRSRGFERA